MKKKHRPIDDQMFVCIDCEATGLDPENDVIVEIAAAKYNAREIFEQIETLVDPQILIPEESIRIHNISDKMVEGKPTIDKVLPEYLEFIGDLPIMGHAINFDIQLVASAAERAKIPCNIQNNKFIDTLRMARLYGESPANSLEQLRKHFNIEFEGTHRAMGDVLVNIHVFRQLVKEFDKLDDLFRVLKKPIALRYMPLGPHKGRLLKEVPLQWLKWASSKDFDEDLLFTIRSEIKNRGRRRGFDSAINPFMELG